MALLSRWELRTRVKARMGDGVGVERKRPAADGDAAMNDEASCMSLVADSACEPALEAVPESVPVAARLDSGALATAAEIEDQTSVSSETTADSEKENAPLLRLRVGDTVLVKVDDDDDDDDDDCDSCESEPSDCEGEEEGEGGRGQRRRALWAHAEQGGAALLPLPPRDDEEDEDDDDDKMEEEDAVSYAGARRYAHLRKETCGRVRTPIKREVRMRFSRMRHRVEAPAPQPAPASLPPSEASLLASRSEDSLLAAEIASAETLESADRTYPHAAHTVVLFDWDDTLLSSTWLSAQGHRVDDFTELPPALVRELRELEELVVRVLREAGRHGTVRVVTNAETGWVQLSAQRFIPGVLKHMEQHGITVVSARSTYECEYPNSPSDWKTQAFKAELERHPNVHQGLNLVVLGDSVSEREAAHTIGRTWLRCSKIKTVKFVERPALEQLRRQLLLVHHSFAHLCTFDGSFDVNLVC